MIEPEKMTTHNLMAVVRDPYHSDEERQQARQEIKRRMGYNLAAGRERNLKGRPQ